MSKEKFSGMSFLRSHSIIIHLKTHINNLLLLIFLTFVY